MENRIHTHNYINQKLCGTPLEVKEGSSRVSLTTTSDMAVDDHDLVHGGFIFGLADFAAMIAVNDPNVVLGSAEVKFQKPVKVGETVIAVAEGGYGEGKKRPVQVSVKRDTETVFEGTFICFVLDRHVLGD
ncbi:MAG: thioesterase [Deltaproteobacteria bacterium]|jgi:acyl-coenzyme A thioesterase PaaI-like protein|nr:thioesterase [Deltaproteobacteria bacterium]MBT4267317.1 thioesterase [Deltaproteobacteria bacterium]MBT4638210.1 thioesterase [Deltaproteobacteria bacterium]MBT6501378.1 thioesterase [Deltaproteobacteria bacterium]MBT6616249.1 thioesterase [Deltaproteobacteria bacterium]